VIICAQVCKTNSRSDIVICLCSHCTSRNIKGQRITEYQACYLYLHVQESLFLIGSEFVTNLFCTWIGGMPQSADVSLYIRQVIRVNLKLHSNLTIFYKRNVV